MDLLQQFTKRARTYVYLLLLLSNGIILIVWYVCDTVLKLPTEVCLAAGILLAILLPALIVTAISDMYVRPLRAIWQAILFASPDARFSEAPDMRNLQLGRELVVNLMQYISKLGQATTRLTQTNTNAANMFSNNFVANSLPLPLLILDKDDIIMYANKALLDYIHKSSADTLGKGIHNVLDLSFTSEATLDTWLAYAKENSAIAQETWERVRLVLPGDANETKLLDMAAYYNKNNPSNHETILVLFDHTSSYGSNEQAVNFVALAVHELRTPLTMLRGYIEALEEDLSGTLNPELEGYMRKMKVSAQQLTSFVNNVLNVARIDEDQLTLNLQETDWGTTLVSILEDLSAKASVYGMTMHTTIQPNLPTVGVDKVSMYEVMNNLVDNAIKYNGASKEITIRAALANDGTIETSVQDFGVGIPTTAMPHLFTKFYRDHHNKQHVGGTGIGLYLCKKLVGAHGGNIWVRSKEGEGSTFSFTLIPYERLADELKNKDNNGIVRSAHGWIKNHSLYRR